MENIVKQNFFKYVDQIVINKKISHAYLIEIDDYDQDSSYILDFVKMVMFDLQYSKISTLDTNINKMIDNNCYPDLRIIEAEGSVIKKSQLVDLQNEFYNTSLLDEKRVYVIRDVEKLNSFSANTILKFLEEPVNNVIAILLCKNRYSIIETILSRCQILSLSSNFFNDFNLESEFLEIIRYIVFPNEYFINSNFVFKNLILNKNDCLLSFKFINNYLINYINNYFLGDSSLTTDIYKILDNSNIGYLSDCISIIDSQLYKLNYNVNYKIWLDSIFSKIVLLGG